MTTSPEHPEGSLAGLRVLDLSRILAGPTCAQLLGDLGAEVIKIERPETGDDTRGWGPPFLRDADGKETQESAYYLSANRNKRSLAIDLASVEGQAIVRDIAIASDILIENFKVGDLKRRGLDYATLKTLNPRLIYCSITGFGQDGAYAARAGYDFMIQGMGGIMSLTGFADEDGGKPTKVGVGIADVMTGMYATSAILAALNARHRTGKGQHIDVSLFDSQLAWLINQGVGYLTDGQVPPRRGNDHPTIVPYGTFDASDGPFILAIGNDRQFRAFCELAGVPDLAADPRFARNRDRVDNRTALIPIVNDVTRMRPAADWIAALETQSIPCGPINDLRQAFGHPVTVHRGMVVTMPHQTAVNGSVSLIGNPLKMSATPVTYRHAPPRLGEHSEAILRDVLGLDAAAIADLKVRAIIAGPGDSGETEA